MAQGQFSLQPLDRFKGCSATIKRPREITCFSYDENHQFRHDDSSLSYYYPPRLGTNLSKGFDSFRKRDDSEDEHLDGLLKAIIELEGRTGTHCAADIITWRGMMTKIMTAPFDNFNDFEMNATLFQGTIFLEENHSYKLVSRADQLSRPTRPGNASQQLMTYWGYKFETLSLLPKPWAEMPRDFIETRDDLPVSNHAQYCSVVSTRIGSSTMILGGEVDAVWDVKPSPPDPEVPINWVELKTAQQPNGELGWVKFERKLVRFWAQSFLLGVPKIVVGWRDEGGILSGLEEIETRHIPGEVMRRGRSWDGNVCINFTAAFLEFLRETITREGVWRIRKKPKASNIEIIQVEESGTGEVLSEEFLRWRRGHVRNGSV